VAWIVSAAFNSVQSLVSARLIPRSLTTENFTSLFGNATTPFARWIGNSYKVALTAAIINVLLASLAAYAFSRMRFRGRRMGLLALLLVQVFPQFLGFIALFLLAQQIGEVFPQAGLGTHLFLIMVYLGGAIGFNAFLIKGFMDTIPASLDESARVDGAGPFQIFWSVVFPLARPVLAVIFIITFTNLFAEYILASTLITSTANYTMPVGLQLFVSSDYSAKWGNLAAAALIGAAPIVATFLIAQKQIIGGLTTGAVKG
jgi:ABC-type maltose transport system permease subunit